MKNKDSHLFQSWAFKPINYIILIIGLLLILTGYIMMGTGETESYQSVKLSPIILFLGYCIVIPIAIFYQKK
tara:strand:+ start:187 stop:402 length:216 start_codon:yes stop_codon:yes gene_type:complete